MEEDGKGTGEKEQRKKSRGKEQKPGILQAEKMAVIMDSRNEKKIWEAEYCMLYTIPHYYKKFQCIAGECPDT